MTTRRYDKRRLPHEAGRLFVTEGGMETVMIFRKGIELPAFSSIELVRTFAGRAQLAFYYETYLSIARATGLGLILDTATWRASPDWQAAIGFPDRDTLAQAHRAAIRQLQDLREDHETADVPVLISGTVGPRGDGYSTDATMTTKQAEDYHAWQMRLFADTEVDMVTALTIPTVNEAIGIARAAAASRVPLALSFTVETDGRLPSGVPLADAVVATDDATGASPLYYMVNCAHPDHIARTLSARGDWIRRIGGIRANASRCSHAELDGCDSLDDGDPRELAAQLWQLRLDFPGITVLGGCCGTDHRHIAEIARTCLAHGSSRHRHAAE